MNHQGLLASINQGSWPNQEDPSCNELYSVLVSSSLEGCNLYPKELFPSQLFLLGKVGYSEGAPNIKQEGWKKVKGDDRLVTKTTSGMLFDEFNNPLTIRMWGLREVAEANKGKRIKDKQIEIKVCLVKHLSARAINKRKNKDSQTSSRKKAKANNEAISLSPTVSPVPSPTPVVPVSPEYSPLYSPLSSPLSPPPPLFSSEPSPVPSPIPLSPIQFLPVPQFTPSDTSFTGSDPPDFSVIHRIDDEHLSWMARSFENDHTEYGKKYGFKCHDY